MNRGDFERQLEGKTYLRMAAGFDVQWLSKETALAMWELVKSRPFPNTPAQLSDNTDYVVLGVLRLVQGLQLTKDGNYVRIKAWDF